MQPNVGSCLVWTLGYLILTEYAPCGLEHGFALKQSTLVIDGFMVHILQSFGNILLIPQNLV